MDFRRRWLWSFACGQYLQQGFVASPLLTNQLVIVEAWQGQDRLQCETWDMTVCCEEGYTVRKGCLEVISCYTLKELQQQLGGNKVFERRWQKPNLKADSQRVASQGSCRHAAQARRNHFVLSSIYSILLTVTSMSPCLAFCRGSTGSGGSRSVYTAADKKHWREGITEKER